MDMAAVPAVNWSPFKEEDVYKLGLPENWPKLLRILEPFASCSFAVTDAASQAAIDDVRVTLDLSAGPYAGLSAWKRNIVELVLSVPLTKESPLQVLELLLAVGADPDIPGGDKCRASHNCGLRGHLDAASVLFWCRPDMTAKDRDENTPLGATERSYRDDKNHPERKVSQKYVAKFIKDGGFEKGFPTLAQLAVQKKWTPMKNLLRRQVIKEAEFTELRGGKTAAEWAEFFGETLLAKEIRYYKTPAAVRMRAVFSLLRHEVSRVKSSLNDKVERLTAEVQKGEEKIAELSETVGVLRSKLDGNKEEEGVAMSME